MNLEDAYKPWQCETGHFVTIRQVTAEGQCGLCNTPVRFASCKDEISRVLSEEALAPFEFVLDPRGRRLRVKQKECKHCHSTYKTPYANEKLCSDACREAYEVEQLAKRPTCRICGKLLEAPDRRWKYCERPDCQRYRRGGPGNPGK